MTGRGHAKHRVLIVEDDDETAEDLAAIVGSLGCESVTTANREEAATVLRGQQICVVLLDLQIRESADGIKGHVEHGKALLREIRRTHGERAGQGFWLPVVIVSGYAREVPTAVEVMKDGASDLIQKPLESSDVSEKVRSVLRESGRLSHELCLKGIPPLGPNAGDDVVLAVTGERVGRRTVVMVGHTRLQLTDSSLRVLLHLMVAHRLGGPVHKRDLGANNEQGFKGISILRAELKPALADGVDIIDNDYHGNYCLSAGVRIGEVDTKALDDIGDQRIAELAAQLRVPKPKV